jgi:cytidylate kinase
MNRATPLVIAIDGPAASGKSSTAAAVAARTGLVHVDSGAWYRALTWLAVRTGADRPGAIVAAAEAAHLAGTVRDGTLLLRANDAILDQQLRAPDVTARVSGVAALPEIRKWVDDRLRAAVSALDGAVVDGRDIGTVVFPAAPLKIFLTASPSARAQRRLVQLGSASPRAEVEREAARLGERDRRDAARAVAPLRPAADAVVIDTTALTFEEQVAEIMALLRARGLLGRA